MRNIFIGLLVFLLLFGCSAKNSNQIKAGDKEISVEKKSDENIIASEDTVVPADVNKTIDDEDLSVNEISEVNLPDESSVISADQ